MSKLVMGTALTPAACGGTPLSPSEARGKGRCTLDGFTLSL